MRTIELLALVVLAAHLGGAQVRADEPVPVSKPGYEKVDEEIRRSARQEKLEVDLRRATRLGQFQEVDRLLLSATNNRPMRGGWFWHEALQSKETNTIRRIHGMGINWENFFSTYEGTISTNDLIILEKALLPEDWKKTIKELSKWLVMGGMRAEIDHLLERGLPMFELGPDYHSNKTFEAHGLYLGAHDLLMLSLASRDRRLFEHLLSKGANPDDPPRRDAMITHALEAGQLHALQALNPPEPLASLLRDCLGRFSPKTNSPFVGSWAYMKEGFGSFSFRLEADGTGSYATDWGGMAFFWEDRTNHVACYQILPNAMWKNPWAQLQTNGLVLVSTNALLLTKDPSTASLYVTNQVGRIRLQQTGK